MQTPDDDTARPLHPIQESVGFISAALAALGGLFWPRRRKTPDGEEAIVSDAEPLVLTLTEAVESLAPFPVND